MYYPFLYTGIINALNIEGVGDGVLPRVNWIRVSRIYHFAVLPRHFARETNQSEEAMSRVSAFAIFFFLRDLTTDFRGNGCSISSQPYNQPCIMILF